MQTSVLITITGPYHRVDLEVPAEIPIKDLLPTMIEMCATQPVHPLLKNSTMWGLGLQDSAYPLGRTGTLLDAGVVDGSILVLQSMEYWAKHENSREIPQSLRSVVGGWETVV